MKNTVFILGAGASKQAGAPLMAEFLDVARNLWETDNVKPAAHCFERVFKAIGQLQQVHSKSQMDLNNIESVFTTCEMAQILGKFPGKTCSEIDDLLTALKVVIVKTLERTMRFPTHNRHIQAPPPYGKFAKFIRRLQEKAMPRHKVIVITFNYDIGIDTAFYFEGLKADYALEADDSAESDKIPLLKLHGSLNWTETSPEVTTKAVVPWDIGTYFGKRGVPEFHQGAFCHIPIGSQLLEVTADTKKIVTGEAVLVPPTWNKADSHRAISKVWRKAAEALTEADNIFVAGYSLPPNDGFFRYLYALGTVGPRPLQRFWVLDPDKTGSVKSRFESLLGHGAQARFQYFTDFFESAIDQISGEFPTPTNP